MKSTNLVSIVSLFLIIIFSVTNCTNPLEPNVNSELSSNTLNTKEGMNALLSSAYANAQINSSFGGRVGYTYSSMLPAGLAWTRKGGVNSNLQPLIDFTWTSDNQFLGAYWNVLYEAIRDANIVLANIENDNFSTEFINQVTAEAKFIRGWSYSELYVKFGPIPLQKTPTDDPRLPRASEEEMRSFIEQQLSEAASTLPVEQEEYGRATKGAVLGVLSKYYLNTKQWQKSADIAEQIIDMNEYRLMSNYEDVFALENEGNKELLWVLPYNGNSGNNINAFTFPVNYPLPFTNIRNFAAETFLFDSFVNSFEDNDSRKELIQTEYTTTAGEQFIGLGNDQSLPRKYPFDPNGSGGSQGQDVPVVRYADILLSQAEALNEINGPTQESIDLINQVRERAGVEPLDINDFNKESLRDQIFAEREKEFFYEFKTREFRIRQGTFISIAQSRGKNAQSHHVLYPIPQEEMDANPQVNQNPGY